MKLNLKSTIAAPADQTLNGIIGNTRRGIQVDQALDPDSNNPVANKPVSTALAALADQLGGKQDKLTAGNNITIEGTTISATRPENMALYGDLTATDADFTGGTGGGGSGGVSYNILVGTIEVLDNKGFSGTYTGEIDANKINIFNLDDGANILIGYINTANPLLGSTLVDMNGDYYSLSLRSNQFILTRIPLILCNHFIILSSNTLGHINFNYYDTRKEPHTIDTLKTALKGRTVSCSGYIDNSGTKEIATYIEGTSNGSLSVSWFNISDGSTGGTTLDNTITISDTVKPVE